MLLVAIVSVSTVPPTSEQVQPFLWRAGWLSALGDGARPRPWWQSVRLWFAVYALAWGYVYWRFW